MRRRRPTRATAERYIFAGMNSTENQEVLDTALTLIHSRQHTSPKRLGDPGPDREQIEQILTAAGAAPDHGLLTPWRLVIIAPERIQPVPGPPVQPSERKSDRLRIGVSIRRT
jgi:hypothetical protein